MNKQIFTLCAGAALAVLVLVGCKKNNRPDDLPDGVECVVSVVQDGKPLEGATLLLNGVDAGNQKYAPGGTTDANGDCSLCTYGFPGVAPGKYKVCIWKDVQEGGETEIDEETGEETSVVGQEFMTVEQQYRIPNLTPLEVEITKGMEKPVFDVGESIRVPKR
ncbi:MAG: carboxypeptidase regulatory-like domain-containing protein [Thermoguttaceae bacterium]|nr:carboxypeptidase regulatory-like domain-containing protein [Thermoguttaceae bacterium]